MGKSRHRERWICIVNRQKQADSALMKEQESSHEDKYLGSSASDGTPKSDHHIKVPSSVFGVWPRNQTLRLLVEHLHHKLGTETPQPVSRAPSAQEMSL